MIHDPAWSSHDNLSASLKSAYLPIIGRPSIERCGPKILQTLSEVDKGALYLHCQLTGRTDNQGLRFINFRDRLSVTKEIQRLLSYPDPVCAMPTISLPATATGIALAWIGDGLSKPIRSTVARMRLSRPRSRKPVFFFSGGFSCFSSPIGGRIASISWRLDFLFVLGLRLELGLGIGLGGILVTHHARWLVFYT